MSAGKEQLGIGFRLVGEAGLEVADLGTGRRVLENRDATLVGRRGDWGLLGGKGKTDQSLAEDEVRFHWDWVVAGIGKGNGNKRLS